MIIIDKQTRGRHGNKVFHFHTLMQLANLIDQEPSTSYWDGYESFVPTCSLFIGTGETAKEIPFEDLIYKNTSELKDLYSSGAWKLHSLSLCGPFFRITKTDPRNFIRLSEPPKLKGDISVGIHLRGTDTRGADGMNCREIHSPEYYIESIDFVLKKYEKPTFYFCTDDPDTNFPSYAKTLKYLKDKSVDLEHDISNNYIKDFGILSQCDILIAGSSTFVTAAAIIGKSKKIIHSKDFVEQFIDGDQKWYSKFANGMFFHDMNHIRSDFYNVWKLI
tara:strand:- start:1240 stop:2067 length:828 start_codon:yes stop_codon:yes gene_type:complete